MNLPIAGYEYMMALPKVIQNALGKRIYAWWLLNRRLGAGPFTTSFKRGMLCTETEYERAYGRRKSTFDILDKFFSEYSLWVLPTAPSAAIPRSMCGKDIKTAAGTFEYSKYLGSYTVPTTILGTPVLSCPIGFDENGLPIGVQVHGPRFSDRWLAQIASRLRAK